MKNIEPGYPAAILPGVHDANEPLIALLEQLASVVSNLGDAQYVQKPVGVIESSIGGHVRHCLDHVRSLLEATATGQLDYDHRQRGTAIESSRTATAEAVDQFIDELRTLPEDALDRPLALRVLLTPDQPPLLVKTSVGREMAYVVAHTIHHNALIGAMVKTLGGWLPERFGYAPSTLKHREAQCAR